MDKVKTIVIEDGQLIQDIGITTLTNDYVELIPKNYIARYLKFNITFKNLIPNKEVTTESIVPEQTATTEPIITEEVVDNSETTTTTNDDTTGEQIEPTSEVINEVVNNDITESIVNDTRFPLLKLMVSYVL